MRAHRSKSEGNPSCRLEGVYIILGAFIAAVFGVISGVLTERVNDCYKDEQQQQSLVLALLADVKNLKAIDEARQPAWKKAMDGLIAVQNLATPGGRPWLMAEIFEPTSTAVFDANASRIGNLSTKVAEDAFLSYSLYAQYKAHMRLLADPSMPQENGDEKKAELNTFNEIRQQWLTSVEVLAADLQKLKEEKPRSCIWSWL